MNTTVFEYEYFLFGCLTGTTRDGLNPDHLVEHRMDTVEDRQGAEGELSEEGVLLLEANEEEPKIKEEEGEDMEQLSEMEIEEVEEEVEEEEEEEEEEGEDEEYLSEEELSEEEMDEEQEVGEMLEHLQQHLRGFGSGFSHPGKTELLFSTENDNFTLAFTGVTMDGETNLVTVMLEKCYDWSQVMGLVLEATRDYSSHTDILDKTELALGQWMTTFPAWGLLSSILSPEKQQQFLEALVKTREGWREELGGTCTETKVFETVKFVNKHLEGKGLGSLVPPVWARLQNLPLSWRTCGMKTLFILFQTADYDVQVGRQTTAQKY